MVEEFRRFGLADSQRVLTGILQLLGAAGLLFGFLIPALGVLASTGLALMMLVAIAVRMKIKDGLAQSVPSLVFMLINACLALNFFRLL